MKKALGWIALVCVLVAASIIIWQTTTYNNMMRAMGGGRYADAYADYQALINRSNIPDDIVSKAKALSSIESYQKLAHKLKWEPLIVTAATDGIAKCIGYSRQVEQYGYTDELNLIGMIL